jgi:hypothetical protein
MVFFDLSSKSVAMIFLAWPKNQGWRFSGLGLKIDNYGLVICMLKSLRQFLGLGLKTRQTSVSRLCHKTDGGRTV